MQNPTDQAETSIPAETTAINNVPNWIRTVKVPRKAAKRTLPFDFTGEQLNHMTSPQAEGIPARKKPRLEEPLPTTTDQATRQTDSPDVSVEIFTTTADNDDANSDPMTDTPNNAATRATRRWTIEEDAKLARAVANTSKKKRGNEYKTNWAAISELIPGRTKNKCWHRWHDALDPSIDRASAHKGKWEEYEDIKLKDAVQMHGGKNWGSISALVPGRTQKQCWHRWNDVLDPNIGRASGRKGKWTAVEDSKLKGAVQTHGDKDWVAISLLVPGRTNIQCWGRWHDSLNPSMSLPAGHTGT
jgi:hypothetical protein